MEFYIQAASAMAPQKTGDRMTVPEPDYTTLIDPRSIRRMSRIIRMGVGTAAACLREAGLARPDAIVTGTAYGCLADTGVFLGKMIEQREEMLPPTAFIQSTHNTVGGQIALLLQCHGYNNTFVHRGHSFESALLDAMLLLQEDGAGELRQDEGKGSQEGKDSQGGKYGQEGKDAQGLEKGSIHVLVGGIEEITEFSHTILSRFGLYRHTIAGEGAAFFLLTGRQEEGAWAKLEGLETFIKPKDSGGEQGSAFAIEVAIEDRVRSFLQTRSLRAEDIDLVIMGNNGDPAGDALYERLSSAGLRGCPVRSYKDRCGEYPTSVSFALWLAADIVRQGEAKRVLIYNHYQGIYHSLLLIAGC